MKQLFAKIFGTENDRILKKLTPELEKINSFENVLKNLSDQELKEKTKEFKARMKEGEELDVILPEAFAVVREASVRTQSLRPYDVQMIGGMVLHQGMIAEMRTGEGKTLVATLPAYVNALTEKGVHVITVNDHLARRDAVWMGQVYAFLGLSVSVINTQNTSYLYDPSHVESDEERDEVSSFRVMYEFLKPCSRKEAYAADITYGTNAEFGFDYLRDNTQYSQDSLVQRGNAYAIIDEVDSILIDEARVPLILSSFVDEVTDMYVQFAGIVRQLQSEDHFTIDEKMQAVQITDAGISKAEELLGIENLYSNENIRYVHQLETALRAKALFQKDKKYVIREGEIVLVDEFTGRMTPGRRLSDGLHQALEAKENVTIQQETKTLASITYQNYFRFYDKLSGMTGTAETSDEEFRKVYNVDVIVIPTNRSIARKDHSDLIFQTEQGKLKAVAKKVKELHQEGQPVLVGTASIQKNEMVSAYLTSMGVPHNVLNAKNHELEAEITAEAGKNGAVTIATNMAGRGIDIKLGGALATQEEYENIKNKGGLYVLGTERHEARRIDNQLRGRAGRQGDPGETQFYVSLEDDLMRVFGGDKALGMVKSLGLPEDEAIYNPFVSRALESAQKRIEGFHFDARKSVLEYDTVLNKQRETVYAKRKSILFARGDEMSALAQDISKTVDPKQQSIIQEKQESFGKESFHELIRRVALRSIDMLWMSHLDTMDHARRSVNLRAYGQREPLVEYKKEGLRLFRELEQNFTTHVADYMIRVEAPPKELQVTAIDLNKQSDANSSSQSVSSFSEKFGRNEKISITKDGETQEIKFKKLDSYLSQGWTIVEEK